MNKEQLYDLVAVVRCKDCKHFDCGVCEKIYPKKGGFPPQWVDDDHYCSYGKKKRGFINDK